jgi:aminoglycoside 6'-N-acetyltransferase I
MPGSRSSIRLADSTDVDDWLALRAKLWSDQPHPQHLQQIATILNDGWRARAFVCVDEAGERLGFVETRVRDSIDGSASGPVLHLDGVYVRTPHRRLGHARELIEHAMNWGATRGCRECVSSAVVDDTDRHALHRAFGFEEQVRFVSFRRPLERIEPLAPSLAAAVDSDLETDAFGHASTSLPLTTPRKSWWIHACVIVLGIASMFHTDPWSGDVVYGGLLLLVDVAFVLYVFALMAWIRYRGATTNRGSPLDKS